MQPHHITDGSAVPVDMQVAFSTVTSRAGFGLSFKALTPKVASQATDSQALETAPSGGPFCLF